MGESSSHQEVPGSVSEPNLFSLQASEVQAHNALDVVIVLTDPGPSETEAACARDLPDFGWCRIVEEPPDD